MLDTLARQGLCQGGMAAQGFDINQWILTAACNASNASDPRALKTVSTKPAIDGALASEFPPDRGRTPATHSVGTHGLFLHSRT